MAYNFKVNKGYDLSGYDQDLVRQAQGGSGWDHNDQARYDKLVAERSKAKEKAQSFTQQQTQTSAPSFSPEVQDVVTSTPTTTTSNSSNVSNQSNTINSGDGKNGFNVGGDLKQTIGKQGDMTTTIGNNNQFGAGTSIGNDYSVTIGNQNAGNGGNGSGSGGGLDNMMSAAAYSALNNNAWAKSSSQVNGYGRSQGAIDEANKQLGVKDRVASLYNLTGMDQNYWRQKSTAQQGFYLGDIFNFRSPEWTMPSSPKKPEDKTEEIANKFDP